MKKIKDPALFEKIRKFLTEDMPVLRKKSPNTVEAYRYTLNIYLVFLCEKHSKSLYNITVKDFSQKNILFFLDWLIEERGNKASTANLRLRHIKRFCRFLMDENILMISELSAIQKIAEIPNASEDTIKFLTIQETKLILSQPDTSKAIGIRDSLFMYLLYDSGCRIQEILSLKLKDFFVQNGTAELHIIGKGNKFRITPISEELIPKLNGIADTIIKAAPMMITCSIQSEEGSARKCPVILRRLLLKNMESWHRNSTRPFPMYTPIYLGTPALCTCIWQVCRWSLFPNGSAILSWRHL